MHVKKIAAAAAVALGIAALGGCAAFDPGNRLAEFKYAPGSNTDAIVIMSAGSAESCVGNPASIRVSQDGDRWHLNIETMFVANGVAEKSLFADHQGTVVVFHLPAGRHYVFPWPLNGTLRVTETPRTDFTVAAGEVVYLGEVFIDSGCAWKNTVSYHDQFERDMAILKARNPAFAQAPVIKRVLTDPRKADVF